MGLFKKKPDSAIEALRTEMVELHDRVDAAEQAKARLEDRLSALDAATSVYAQDSVDSDAVHAALQALEVQAEQMEELRLAAQLREQDDPPAPIMLRPYDDSGPPAASTDAVLQQLGPQLEALARRIEEVAELAAAPITPDDHLAARLDQLTITAASVDELRIRIDELTPAGEPVLNDELAAQLAQLAVTAASVEELRGRIDNLSTNEPVPNDELAAQLAQLAATAASVEELRGRMDQLTADDDTAASDELAAQLAATTAIVDELRGRIDELATNEPAPTDELTAQLTATAASVEYLRSRIEDLAASRNAGPDDELAAQLAQLTATAASVDELRGRIDQVDATDQIAQLAERVTLTSNEARIARDQVAAIEHRLAGVSTELANQLEELGKDLDALSTRPEPAAPSVDPQVLADLRTAQVRLAEEQARYEIAFREDLAALAEQIRTLRGR